MNERKVIESILLLAAEPIPARTIAEVLERPRAEIEGALQALAASYRAEDRGFELRVSAGGWRLYTTADSAPWLERFVKGQSFARLTPAALEVLAIVAYKGPLSRSQIAEVRGIDSDGVVRTLEARGLIAGREGGPGGSILFAVTPTLMEYLGVESLDELPPLSSFMPDADAVEDMEAKLSPRV